jgi:hypothetical protein
VPPATRRLGRAATLAVLLGTAILVVQLTGPPVKQLWEMVIVAALVVTVWRRVPAQPVEQGPSSPIWARHRVRPPASLLSLELEVAGAGDPRLGDEVRLRRRLVALAAHRSGLPTDEVAGEGARRLLGERAAGVLTGTGPIAPEEVEMLIERIGAL